MPGTLWDSFESLLEEAENHFLNFRFDAAIAAWEKYYEITAKTEYRTVIKEISAYLENNFNKEIPSIQVLYRDYKNLQDNKNAKKVSRFTFDLLQKLFVRIYRTQFSSTANDSIEAGIFDFLNGDYEKSQKKLEAVLTFDSQNILARIYLGHTLIKTHEQKEAIALLSENLFFAADQLSDDDLYLSQFRLLFGKLFSDTGHKEEAAWLLTFESWYRSYLVFREDKDFYRLMQEKEQNERIIQVKYYKHERYRHFVRCLYLADYNRQFHKEKRALIREQENYMQKLDRDLFARYRKKRSEL